MSNNRIKWLGMQEDLVAEVAEFLIKQIKGRDFSKIAVVFGGKRPSLFLNRRLAQISGGCFVSPRYFTMDELTEYIVTAGKGKPALAGGMQAAYLIYRLSKQISPEIISGRESFPRFLPWAREIHSLIEQFDLEDLPETALEAIQKSAEIGYDVPENINRLLSRIVLIRQAYHDNLKETGIYSRGTCYRQAAISSGTFDFPQFEKIIFCGFYYLHKTEEKIIANIFRNSKGWVFLQGDPAKWPVLSQLQASYPALRDFPEEPQPQTQIFRTFDIHSEVCLARKILQEEITEPDRTLILVPEPQTIIPLLNEIGTVIPEINVSMGYPMDRNPLCGLLKAVFAAQRTLRRDLYYSRDYLNILCHPLTKNFTPSDYPAELTRMVIHVIDDSLSGNLKSQFNGRLFIDPKQITDSDEIINAVLEAANGAGINAVTQQVKGLVDLLHKVFFGDWEGTCDFRGFCRTLKSFIYALIKDGSLSKYPLNFKIAEKILALQDELAFSSFSEERFAKIDIFDIFESMMENEKIAFSGSPLKGLQVLGLLETRSLSFQNVIVVDANESLLPRIKISQPLIPRQVMLELGLARLEKEEEIQHYHFSRLLSSCKRAFIIFREDDNGKQKSRFVEELVWQRQRQSGELETAIKQARGFRVKLLPVWRNVEKSADMIAFLKDSFIYSASSLNTYLNCQLKFYFRYVLGLKPRENTLSETGQVDIGNFLHDFLMQAFLPYQGNKPLYDGGFRKAFLERLESEFDAKFSFRPDAFLLKQVMVYRMNRFLDCEKARDYEKVLLLEKPIEDYFQTADLRVRLKARIDRLDCLRDSSIMVIDYKTGGTPPLTLPDMSALDRRWLKKHLKSVQLPLYLACVSKIYPQRKLNAGIYDLRLPQLQCMFKSPVSEGLREMFSKILEIIIKELLDPSQPFSGVDTDSRDCNSCDYFYMCR